jgi:hypothetical protein
MAKGKKGAKPSKGDNTWMFYTGAVVALIAVSFIFTSSDSPSSSDGGATDVTAPYVMDKELLQKKTKEDYYRKSSRFTAKVDFEIILNGFN